MRVFFCCVDNYSGTRLMQKYPQVGIVEKMFDPDFCIDSNSNSLKHPRS